MDPFSADEAQRPRAARKAEFVRFHNDTYPGLVALLHALRGDRLHAHRAAQRAFAEAWLRWERVRSLPDPAGWTRRRARLRRPPRRRPAPPSAAGDESGWITPPARPIFDALSELPSELRTVLALHHIGGLTHEQIADEERLPRGEVSPRLAYAGQALALRMGRATGEGLADGPAPSAIDPWVARELADLTHALSYRTDRRAADEVFGQAVRHRAGVAAATLAVVAIAGAGGLLALRQNVPGIPEAVSGAAVPPRSAGPSVSTAPTLPGVPPMSGAAPTPAVPPPPGALPMVGALLTPGSPSSVPGANRADHEAGRRTGPPAHRDQARDARGGGVRPAATPGHPRPSLSTGPLSDGLPRTYSRDWPDGGDGQSGPGDEDGGSDAGPGYGGRQWSGPDDGPRGRPGGGPRGGGRSQPHIGGGRGR